VKTVASKIALFSFGTFIGSTMARWLAY